MKNQKSEPDVLPPASHGFSEKTKKQYAEIFLTPFSVGNRKCVQATPALVKALKRLVHLAGNDKATIGSFVQSVVENHLQEHCTTILELREVSLRSDSTPEAMDSLTKEAKAYQAKFLTGDGLPRTLKGIYINRDLVDRLRDIVLEVSSEHPTCGSYLDAIVTDHLKVCEDLLADIVNDKMPGKL